jgi:nucleolar MIF4G domain-containing protein 1
MEQKFLSRKQKRKMERKQKKEKMNQYYMKKFSKNKNNFKNKFNNKKEEEPKLFKKQNQNSNKSKSNTLYKDKKNNNILFDDDKIDIADIDLEEISDKKDKKDEKKENKIQNKKIKDDIDLDLEYLEKKLKLNNNEIMEKYKKSMAIENYDADIFDFLDNIDSSVQKSIDKYKKYDPKTFNKNSKKEDISEEKEDDNENKEIKHDEEEDENEEFEGEEFEDDKGEENNEDIEDMEDIEEEVEDNIEDNQKDGEVGKNEKIKNESKEVIPLTKEIKQKNEELINQFKKELTSLLNKIAESNLSLILPAIFSKISTFFDSYQDKDKISKNKTIYDIISQILIKTIIYPQVINLPIMSCICTFISLLHFVKFGQSFLIFFIKKCLDELNYLKNEDNKIEKYKYKNFIFLIIHLYIFENINSVFIYDLIKFLIDNFNESNSEYLLLLLSYTGINIRKENPSNLKDIITLINIKYNNIKISKDENSTEKIKYIIDMINDIKQNKYLKFNLQEKFNFFKEVLKKQKSDSTLIAGEKLELNLDKINTLSYDKIISNDINITSNNEKLDSVIDLDADDLIIKETQEDIKTTQKLNETMKKLGIVTGLKKMIFKNIATSNSVNDAFERLCRLNFNKEQKREIIKMIIKLCIEEISYNPFYELLLVKLLSLDKDNKYTFHYCIWDYMKIMDNLKIKKIHNLSKLTTNLLLKEKISIPVLLHYQFEEDKNENKIFVNMILNKYFNESTEDKTKLLFAKLIKNDDHVEFAQKLFHFLVKSFSNENNIEQKDEKYQDNYAAALKVLKKIL